MVPVTLQHSFANRPLSALLADAALGDALRMQSVPLLRTRIGQE